MIFTTLFVKKIKEEKGVALYLSFMMLTVLMGLAFGLSVILLGQLQIVRGIGESDMAIYAAESGIERVAYIDTKFCGSESSAVQRVLCINNKIAEIPPSEFQLSNESRYSVLVERGGQGTCPSASNTYCAKSTGAFKGAKRAIRLTR